MDFFELDGLSALVPSLWIVGTLLKRTPLAPDWTIPWILLAISLVTVTTIEGFSYTSVLRAILLCGFSVFGNQLLKQTLKGISSDDDGNEKDGRQL